MRANRKIAGKEHPVSKSTNSPGRKRHIESRDINSDEQRKITNGQMPGDNREEYSDEEG